MVRRFGLPGQVPGPWYEEQQEKQFPRTVDRSGLVSPRGAARLGAPCLFLFVGGGPGAVRRDYLRNDVDASGTKERADRGAARRGTTRLSDERMQNMGGAGTYSSDNLHCHQHATKTRRGSS